MSVDKKKVVIVGSGIGGVGLAALLQSRGYQVTVVEKNNFVGGKCSSYDKDGFVVDAAFHMFSLGEKGPHGIITEKTGGDLKWIHHNPTATIRMGNSGTMQFGITPKKNMACMGSAFVKGSLRPSIINMLRTTLKNYGVRELIDTMIKLAKADETFISSLDDITLFEFLNKFTDDQQVHGLLAAILCILVVVPYTEASAGEMLWCLVKAFPAGGVGVPQGGVRELGGSFRRSFLRFDGELRLGTAVKRIIVDDGKARGVELESGEVLNADLVVSNTGIKRTVEIAGEQNFPTEYVDYVKGLKESYAALMLKLALDRRISSLPRLTYMHQPQVVPWEAFDYLAERGVPEDPAVAMIIPSDYDPSTAHPGRCMVLAGGMGPSDTTPENIDYCTRIMGGVEKRMYEIFPGLESHVMWKELHSVDHVAKVTGKPTGECIGLAQIPGQVGVNKPGVFTPIQGLMLVGCDAGARGVGTEQAANSAIYVSNLLG